jgi:hypothetical protein
MILHIHPITHNTYNAYYYDTPYIYSVMYWKMFMYHNNRHNYNAYTPYNTYNAYYYDTQCDVLEDVQSQGDRAGD